MSSAKGEPDDPYAVPALERGLRLLALFTRSRPELSAIEITRALALPHATVYRLLHTLEKAGLLRRTALGYTLGPRILTLGYEYLSSQSLIELARSELEALRDRTDTSANMGVLDGRDVIYIGHVPSRRPIATRMQVGSRFEAHTSSIGRLLLAGLPHDALAALYKGVKLVRRLNDSPATFAELETVIARDAKRGYVINRGVYDEGIIAVAAPIFDHTGTAVAGVNISGPASSFTSADLKGAIKDQVCASAARISALMGFTAR